jgi:glycosyltransferase involved in cell wall biosynthesis
LFNNKSVKPVTISGESQLSFKKAYNGTHSELIYNGRAYPKKSRRYSTVTQSIEKLKLNNTTKVFVHIGRLTTEKNQLMLIEAFNKLVYKHHANAVLLIIGGGRNTDESRKIQQQLQQAEQEHVHIHLLGERPNATDYLHAADFFCLSSLYEGNAHYVN